ncbi:hypothetical protein Ade02nite_11290 [Paractinoplanes deccanensis]|uniref:Uncharacterized protein n=1 Tax=Paractinoplanes deccanensis TaxID=113561 RepID=A0ABQ3XXM9_9ACTN|nr:hypothetical protein [Actinoplanes deccanensis]GID72488.1 hypothetical protein Ade02nite_11290 [Actinoplanes deccanensis]
MDATQSNDTMADSAPLGRIAAVKAQYPNAYEPWSALDDTRLAAGYKSGLDFDALGAQFGRQPSAVKSRLQKIALERLRNGEI